MTKKSARPIQELDKATRARIEHLMGLEPQALSAGDVAFLKARIDYLTTDQREDYLDGVEVEETEDDETVGDKYDGMTAKELKEELSTRELAVGGKVDELRARLREDDVKEE